MPTVSYHSTTIAEASAQEAVDTTSSQIFLSRGVAGSDSEPASSPRNESATPVALVFESSSRHIMSLGDVPRPAIVERLHSAAVEVATLGTASGVFVQSARRSRYFSSTDGVSSSPPDECQRAPNSTPIASSYFTEEPEDDVFGEQSYSSSVVVDKGKNKEIDRGRSIERGPRYPNPLARAESRLRQDASTIELDARPMFKRPSRSSTFHEDPSDPCAILDDEMLEPCPEAHVSMRSSFSEVLGLPTLEADSQSFNVLRRAESEPFPSRAAGLPTEVILQIFDYLHPVDFNAARHTCRSWLINSLQGSFLEKMLRRGGWSSSIPEEVGMIYPVAQYAGNDQDLVNKEWLLSKRLSRECALGPDWTGNGFETRISSLLHTSTTDFTDVAVHYPGPNSSGTVFTVSCCGRFLMAANGCLIYIYELNKVSSGGDFFQDPGSLRPVTSVICPRRVLSCSMDTSSHRYAVAVLMDGRMGLVCEINPCNLTSSSQSRSRSERPDSSKRASFLDRVSLNSSSSNLGPTRPLSEPLVFTGIVATPPMSTPHTRGESKWQGVVITDSPGAVRTEGSKSRHSSLPRAHVLSPGSRTQSILPPHKEAEPNTKSMPIENGARSLYRNLCSDDDPPRSVAICPQRRCVAFGCSAGIELHWVDALTGQDLNRWFPLTAPSDYLFFLPPRKSVDSAKKLRLISSAARPGERAAISERAFGGRTKHSPFWERLGWGVAVMDDEEVAGQTQGMISRLRNEVRSRGLSGRMDYSDHYRAIPLSDGYHILFTDPSTGLLCLGSDAPVGGPTKLLRKIWFQGPAGEGSPVAYAGGADLTWGVRVVAAFGTGSEQRVMLFSVPSDVFAANNNSQTMVKGSWLKSGTSSHANSLEWMDWWSDDGLQEWLNQSQDPTPGTLPRSVWPVKIRGQEIGKLSKLIDLAIDPGPSMTVWAFGSEGIAKVWQIADSIFGGSIIERLIARDGTIRELDGEGDVEMTDAPPVSSPSSFIVHSRPLSAELAEDNEIEASPSPSPLSRDKIHPPQSHGQESFDGTASFTMPSSAMQNAKADRRYRLHRYLDLVDYDSSTDILMRNLQDSYEGEDMSQESFDEVALAQAGTLGCRTFIGSERLQFRSGIDLVEDLTGIMRIDVEIH